MTDGLENASREWSHPQVKQLIEKQTHDYQWQFLYLGADQDAVEVGMSIGVGAGHSVTYGRGKVKQAMAATAANVSSYRQARAGGHAGAGCRGDVASSPRSSGGRLRTDVGRRRRPAAGGSPYTPASRAACALRSCLTRLNAQHHDGEDQAGEDEQGGPAGGDVLVGRHRVGVAPVGEREERDEPRRVTMGPLSPCRRADQGSGVTPAKRSSSGIDDSTWLVTSS